MIVTIFKSLLGTVLSTLRKLFHLKLINPQLGIIVLTLVSLLSLLTPFH